MNYPGTCGCSYLIELISLRVLITAELTGQGFGAGQSCLAQDFSLICKNLLPTSERVPSWDLLRKSAPQVSLLIRHQQHHDRTDSMAALHLFSPHTPAGCGKALSVLTDPAALSPAEGTGRPRTSDPSAQSGGGQAVSSPKEVVLHPTKKNGSQISPPDNHWTENKDSAYSSGNTAHN